MVGIPGVGGAVVGALLIGEWAEAASAMFLFSLAQLLEARSMDRARHAIRRLLDLSPKEATVRKEDGDIRLPVDRILVGDVVVLRPGERVPVDGVAFWKGPPRSIRRRSPGTR